MRSLETQRSKGGPHPSVSSEATNFLRMSAVIRQTGLGRSTIYRLMAEHRFPQAVRLSGRSIGWRTSDLQQWADSRTAVDV